MQIQPVLIPQNKPSALSKLGQTAQIIGTVGTIAGQPWGPAVAGAGSLAGMAAGPKEQVQGVQAPQMAPRQQAPDVDNAIATRMDQIDPQETLNIALQEVNNLDLPEEQKNIYRQPLLQAYQKGGFA